MRRWFFLLAIGTFALAFSNTGVYTQAEHLAYNDWVVAQIVNISDGEFAGEDTEVIPVIPGMNGDGVDLESPFYGSYDGTETFFSDPRQWSVGHSSPQAVVSAGFSRWRKWRPHQVGEFLARRLLRSQAADSARLLRALASAIKDAKLGTPIRGVPPEALRQIPRGDYRTFAQQALVKLSAVVAACRSGGVSSGVGLASVQRFASLLQQLENVVEIAARDGNAQLAAGVMLESLRPMRVGVAFFEEATLRGGSTAQAAEARTLLVSLVDHLQAIDASLLNALPRLGEDLQEVSAGAALGEDPLAVEEISPSSSANNASVLRPPPKKDSTSRFATALISVAVPLFFVGLTFAIAGAFLHEASRQSRDLKSGVHWSADLDRDNFEDSDRGREGGTRKRSPSWEMSLFSPFYGIKDDVSTLFFP